jgi:signal transduction histidine kinase
MGGSDDQIARLFEQAITAFDAVVFSALTVIGLVGWLRHRRAAAGWFAGMFASLAIVTLAGYVLGDEGGTALVYRIPIAILATFPFFLYRFTRSFTGGFRFLDGLSSVATVVIVSWSVMMAVPQERADWGTLAIAFVIAFLAHWVILSFASAWYFLREARRVQGVAGRRMRMFAAAAVVLATALLLSGVAGGDAEDPGTSVVAAAIQLSGALSAILFLAALAPPRWLRTTWRAREFDIMQGGLQDLLAGETVVDVHERTLTAARRLTGGSAAIVLDRDGEVVAWDGVDLDTAERLVDDARRRLAEQKGPREVYAVGRIAVVAGPAAPFFGADERRLLETLSAFATLAEERADVLSRERDANERLRQLDQLKTEFVAMVAHDLRSPMSVISGFADTIHDRWDDLTDEDKLAYLRLISRNTRSLAEFVEDVLQVARMESGELHYDMHPFDARTVVQRIVTDMQVAHPELQLTVEVPDILPHAMGDEERNWQILNNLVSNAVKFAEGEPEVRLEISLIPDERAVAIAVQDNGIGIADEDLPRLFRRFSRVGSSRGKVAGTGLGLYIVKSMVEAQGGRIWVQSEPGRGSTFTYTLPLAHEELSA